MFYLVVSHLLGLISHTLQPLLSRLQVVQLSKLHVHLSGHLKGSMPNSLHAYVAVLLSVFAGLGVASTSHQCNIHLPLKY